MRILSLLLGLIVGTGAYADVTGVVSPPGGSGGGGGVSSVSFTAANGFSGSVATATSTPAITVSTSITGPLKGSSGALIAAAAADVSGLYGGASGTGTLCLTTNCILTTPNLGTPSAIVLTNATGFPFGAGITSLGALDLTYAATKTAVDTYSVTIAANTSGDGMVLKTPTAAAAASQQYSPRLHLTGQGWATTPVASQPVDWIIEAVPVQGAANPTSTLNISSSVNGGAYNANGGIGSGANGLWNIVGPLQSSNVRVTGATVPTNGIYMGTSNWLTFSSNGTFRGSFDVNGNFTTIFGRGDLSKSVQVPITGFSITIANNTSTLLLNPAGTLASGTIALPTTPFDGMEVQVATSQTITALTVTSSQTINGAPTTLTANTGFKYIYHLAATTWYRLR